MRILLCTAVAAAVAAGSAIGAAPIAKRTPAGTLKAEIAAFNVKNYVGAYSAYTARFKASCPYATFKKHLAAQRAQVPSPLSVKVTRVRTAGAKAFLGYNVLLNGQVVATVKPIDVFVRIKGLWYDEVDSQTTC